MKLFLTGSCFKQMPHILTVKLLLATAPYMAVILLVGQRLSVHCIIEEKFASPKYLVVSVSDDPF